MKRIIKSKFCRNVISAIITVLMTALLFSLAKHFLYRGDETRGDSFIILLMIFVCSLSFGVNIVHFIRAVYMKKEKNISLKEAWNEETETR